MAILGDHPSLRFESINRSGVEILPATKSVAEQTQFGFGETFKTLKVMVLKLYGGDFLTHREIVLLTADKKEVEVRLSPDGKILEDTGAEKVEEKK